MADFWFENWHDFVVVVPWRNAFAVDATIVSRLVVLPLDFDALVVAQRIASV